MTVLYTSVFDKTLVSYLIGATYKPLNGALRDTLDAFIITVLIACSSGTFLPIRIRSDLSMVFKFFTIYIRDDFISLHPPRLYAQNSSSSVL